MRTSEGRLGSMTYESKRFALDAIGAKVVATPERSTMASTFRTWPCGKLGRYWKNVTALKAGPAWPRGIAVVRGVVQ